MSIKHLTLHALLVASFVGVHAQQPAAAPPDREFMQTAAADGHKEIELGRIAEQKATSPAVRTLAQRIQKDHTQADQELKALAKAKGVTLSPPAHHKAEIAKLEKDANFDRTYTSMMVADHQKAIALFERASNSKDSEVKAFAEKTLPALRTHLKLAQEAAGSTSPAGTSGPARQNAPSTDRPSPESR